MAPYLGLSGTPSFYLSFLFFQGIWETTAKHSELIFYHSSGAFSTDKKLL